MQLPRAGCDGRVSSGAPDLFSDLPGAYQILIRDNVSCRYAVTQASPSSGIKASPACLFSYGVYLTRRDLFEYSLQLNTEQSITM